MEHKGHVAPVIGVGCSPDRDGTGQVSGDDRLDRGSTNAYLTLLGQSTGPHGAVPATAPLGTDGAGFHFIYTIESCTDFQFRGSFQHDLRCRVNSPIAFWHLALLSLNVLLH
jgi:hypothetical protein